MGFPLFGSEVGGILGIFPALTAELSASFQGCGIAFASGVLAGYAAAQAIEGEPKEQRRHGENRAAAGWARLQTGRANLFVGYLICGTNSSLSAEKRVNRMISRMEPSLWKG